MRRLSTSAGFTLIEIMVVVLIIGLLAALVGQKIISRVDEARHTSAHAQIVEFKGAIEMFKLDNGFYPSSADGLNALVQRPGNARNWNPDGYMNQIPLDPWGKPYAYFSDQSGFIIKSFGSDGQEGGEGKDSDVCVCTARSCPAECVGG